MQKDIEKIEKIHRKAASFIQKDYNTKQLGSMANLNLPTLDERKTASVSCIKSQEG